MFWRSVYSIAIAPHRKIYCIVFWGIVNVKFFPVLKIVIILNNNFFIPFIQGDTFLPTIDIESTRVFYYSAVLADNYIASILK